MSFGCDFINAGNQMLPSVNSEHRIAVPKELIDNNKKQKFLSVACNCGWSLVVTYVLQMVFCIDVCYGIARLNSFFSSLLKF